MLSKDYNRFDKILLLVRKKETGTIEECIFADTLPESSVYATFIYNWYPNEEYDIFKLPVMIDATIDIRKFIKQDKAK